MKEDLYARLSRRYLALDIHKHYSIVAGWILMGMWFLSQGVSNMGNWKSGWANTWIPATTW